MPGSISSIWQVTSSKSWGGRESVPVALHQAFLTRGIDSRLFCARDSAIAIRHGAQPGVHSLPFTGLMDRATRRLLTEDLRDDPPEVILCHFSHDLPFLRLALGRAKKSRLFLVKHVGPGRPKKDIIHRWVYRRVEAVVAVSEYIARRCRESYPVDPGRVLVWHPGVDVTRFRFQADKRAGLRLSLGLRDSDVLIGYVARLTPGKGHTELIEAFVSLAKEIENIHLVLFGTASHGEQCFATELHRMAQATPQGARVLWPGFVEDVPTWLWTCDIFANPSPAEAFGLNTIEAMAAGRPVIGTTGGGTPEIIAHGENGLLVPPNSPHQLADALRQLIEDIDQRRGLGERAWASACRRFDMPVVVDNLLELVG